MTTSARFNPLDLVLSLAATVDLVSPKVSNHHLRVAYIVNRIGGELGLGGQPIYPVIIAAAMHDIGALTVREKLDTMAFELENPFQHCELGYRLLSKFEPFQPIAEIVRYHHVRWANGNGEVFRGESVPRDSFLLHLADRVEVLIDKSRPALDQTPYVLDSIEQVSGKWFVPDHVEAFAKVARQESFWLDLYSTRLEDILRRQAPNVDLPRDLDTLSSLTRMLSYVIDFQSRFTATHSSGVAAVARALAAFKGYDESKQVTIEMAGHLHDLGKMVIPDSILEKPDKLDADQSRMMRTHTYYTLRALERIEGFEEISRWAAYHHERLDGNGYPFHIPGDQIPEEARLMAVADFFTALTEERPYRKGMAPQAAQGIMNTMVNNGGLDGDMVALAAAHLEELDHIRDDAQQRALEEYKEFNAGIM